MDNVDISFVCLEIVTLVIALRGKGMLLGNSHEAILRQYRGLPRPHIGEDHASSLLARIGFVPDLVSKYRSPVNLRWHVDYPPVNVIEPPMIDAPKAPIFQPPITQIGPPMRAVEPQKTYPPLLIAKQYQLLAEQLHRQWRPS
jgi:hypothetical protein